MFYYLYVINAIKNHLQCLFSNQFKFVFPFFIYPKKTLLADIDMKKFLLHNIQLAVSLFLFLSLGNVGNVF